MSAPELVDVGRVGRDVELEDDRPVALLALDADGVGIVDELAREVREQLGHGA